MIEGRRILNDNGKKYQFDCNAFNDLMLSKTVIKKDSGHRKTKTMIRDELSDKLSVSSDTIKKWESSNGPADISLVKDTAEYFSVDYHKLLIPLETNQEDVTMNENEKKLIEEFSSEAIEALYKKIARERNAMRMDSKERQKQKKIDEAQTEEDLHNLGCVIDRTILTTSSQVRNKLHRIAAELFDLLLYNEVPKRWENGITEWEDGSGYNVIIEFKNVFYRSLDRDGAVGEYPASYLWDEIVLAEKYGIEGNVYPPDWINDTPDCQKNPKTGKIKNNDELIKYGCHGLIYKFSPFDIYADSIVEAIYTVLRYDFWDEKHE